MTKLLNVTNLSALQRFGIKGPAAAEWLIHQGIEVPKNANTWLKTATGLMVLRLGASEFLLEDSLDGTNCAALCVKAKQATQNVYYVARFDASFALSGDATLDLLAELCTLDLRPSLVADDALVMTQIAGISATILRQPLNGEVVYRIWCDGTYDEFMGGVLQEVASEIA